MKCELCGQEATVHELRVVSGRKVERHLCERCARKQGIGVPTGLSVPELIEKYMSAATPDEPPAAVKEAPKPGVPLRTDLCPTCGTTYAEFRQHGLLGCPDCYRTFEAQLGPLLERAHEGGAAHAGKVPRRALSGAKRAPAAPRPEPGPSDDDWPAQRAAKIAVLRKQLDEAVKAEQYERAARLRDDLRKLEAPPTGRASNPGREKPA